MSNSTMPKEVFSIKYDGEKLQGHEMEVAILAPALLNMSKLTQEIARMVSNGAYTTALAIRGNIKAGSIEIELATQPTLAQQIIGFFTSSAVTAFANVGGLVGLLTTTISLVKKHRGAMPKHAQTIDGQVHMHFDDNIEIVNEFIYHTYTNHALRSHLYETLKPLENQGIDSFSINNQAGETLCDVHETQVLYFHPNNIIKPINEQVSTKVLVIESLSFKEKNKWAFGDGQSSIKATITDEDFLKRIDTGEIRFAKGDWLNVELRTIQSEENGKLKATYEVIKVLEHIAREQYKLPFE